MSTTIVYLIDNSPNRSVVLISQSGTDQGFLADPTILEPSTIVTGSGGGIGPDLLAIEALTGTDTIYYRSAADTWSPVTIGSGISFAGGVLVGSGSANLDDDLTAIAALTGTNTLYYRSAESTWSPVIFGSGTNFDNGIITSSGATINTGTMAVQDADNVNIVGGSIVGITDLAIADGGTAASTASNARTNLGLAIGSNIQAWDADLDAIAALGGTNTLYYRSATNTWSAVTFASGVSFVNGVMFVSGTGTIAKQNADNVDIDGGSITNANIFDPDIENGTILGTSLDSVSIASSTISGMTIDLAIADGGTAASTASGARVNLGLVIGSDVQAWDGDLDALASLTGVDTIYYRSAENTWSPVILGSGVYFSNGIISSSGIVDNQFEFGTGLYSLGLVRIDQRQGLRGRGMNVTRLTPSSIGIFPNANIPFIGASTTGGSDLGPVRDLEIFGNMGLSANPHAHDSVDNSIPASGNAIDLTGNHAQVHNCHIHEWRGTAIHSAHVSNKGMQNVHSNNIHSCYTGIRAQPSDQHFHDNVIAFIRNVGMYIPNGAGNVQTSLNHIFACKIACLNDGGRYYRSSMDTFADSNTGYCANTSSANAGLFTSALVQKNNVVGMKFNSTLNSIINCNILVPFARSAYSFTDNLVGIEFNQPRNQIIGGNILLNEDIVPGDTGALKQSTGLRITSNARSCKVLNTLFQDFGNPAGAAIGIHLSGAVKGFDADVRIWGFNDFTSGDVFLKIDDSGIQGVNINIHGNSTDSDNFDNTNASGYVSIPSGWDSTNNIVLIDDATGNEFTLVPGTPY